MYDMIVRLCEQQAAIGAVLHSRRDLLHLEHLPSEWRLLEDLINVLEPFKDATTYLSSESYPTVSALGPLLSQMKEAIQVSNTDSEAIKKVKRAIIGDLKKRYQDPDIQLLLNKATFLDPCMKTLVHLSQTEQESVLNSLTDEMVMASVQTQNDEPTSADQQLITDQNDDTAQPKQQSALQKLLGDSFFHSSDGDDQAPASVSLNELILSEISRYKSEPLVALDEKILEWWQSHGPSYPHLRRLAKKYLSIVATSETIV